MLYRQDSFVLSTTYSDLIEILFNLFTRDSFFLIWFIHLSIGHFFTRFSSDSDIYNIHSGSSQASFWVWILCECPPTVEIFRCSLHSCWALAEEVVVAAAPIQHSQLPMNPFSTIRSSLRRLFKRNIYIWTNDSQLTLPLFRTDEQKIKCRLNWRIKKPFSNF